MRARSSTFVPVIEWVNHASFVTSVGGVRLLCDPWIEGTAFKDGWALLSPTRFGYGDFANISHLWISHQHPDHFAPANLRKIPAQVRARLNVLYRTERGRLVVSWMRSNGFENVKELELERWLEIAPAVELMCGAHDDDSWLALRTPWGTLLNVNDCVLKRADDIGAIARLTGPVDVLFTQFSYAQWTGNPEDVAFRRRDAAEKLERIALQARILHPRIIVPFASFVYFCNAENFFLNDCMNAVGDVAEFVEAELGKRAVVLYPGERWSVDEPQNWRGAAQRYADDVRNRLARGPTHAPASLAAEEVQGRIIGFLSRLRAKNPAVTLLVRDKTTFYLTDSRRAYELSARGLVPSPLGATTVDVATASENVLYAFRTPWGGNTLHVSGRFTSHVSGGHLRFFGLVRRLHHYNRTPIDGQWIAEQCRRVTRGLLRRLAMSYAHSARRFAQRS
jgi:UDP-MurNAc hydroxylase